MISSDPCSPLLTAITRFVGSGRPDNKRRIRPDSVDDDVVLEFPPAFALANEEPVEEKKRKRRRAATSSEEPISRPASPTPPYQSPKKKSRLPKPSKVSRRAVELQSAGEAEFDRQAEVAKAAAAAYEGPKGFWSNSTDNTCPDYDLKRAGKLDGFLQITSDEWLALPSSAHTKYSKKVWQGETRKVVYAIAGELIEGKQARHCAGYKAVGPPWVATVYPDMLFYRSDGHKRTRSSFVARPR